MVMTGIGTEITSKVYMASIVVNQENYRFSLASLLIDTI